jgi:iron complex transport system substrate-binding protein
MTPKRVVVRDPDKLDTMVSLGMAPVGAAQAQESRKRPAYPGSALSATRTAGTPQAPDLEAVIALKPDLIPGSTFRQAAFHDKLSEENIAQAGGGAIWMLGIGVTAAGKTLDDLDRWLPPPA